MPLESVRVVVTDALEYSLLIQSGLSNSCVQVEGYTLNRDGSRIEVTVTYLILDNSALDRLANASYQIVIEGQSYRERLSPHRKFRGLEEVTNLTTRSY